MTEVAVVFGGHSPISLEISKNLSVSKKYFTFLVILMKTCREHLRVIGVLRL